ncbi:MAG: hypothetical protein NT099_06690 [Candidatus Saganbacteria bacterium]|nr:hypothetical protein [Candidatus Saganbacteria bacterium]
MDLGAQIIVITNTSPFFKGIAVIIAGALALWFARSYKADKEEDFGRKVFTYLAIFIILYGIFLLVLRPQWWNPPY